MTRPDLKYINSSMVAVELYDSQEDLTFSYIGSQQIVETVLASAVEGDSIEVFNGSVNLDDIPDGVKVSNTGDGQVIVNGQEIDKDEDPIITHTHKAVKVPAKAATCTEDGNIEYYYCANCGKYFSDATLSKELTKDDVTLPAKDHEWEDDFTIDKQPTAKEEGQKSIHCKNCDAVKDVTAIPVKDSADNTPKTNDNGMLAMYIAFAMISAAFVVIAARKVSSRTK